MLSTQILNSSWAITAFSAEPTVFALSCSSTIRFAAAGGSTPSLPLVSYHCFQSGP
jgi:hypothetical protein